MGWEYLSPALLYNQARGRSSPAIRLKGKKVWICCPTQSNMVHKFMKRDLDAILHLMQTF